MTRQELAYQNLIDILQRYGAGEFAPDVADLYLKERIVTLDARIGQCKFKHGGFLSLTLSNALLAPFKLARMLHVMLLEPWEHCGNYPKQHTRG